MAVVRGVVPEVQVVGIAAPFLKIVHERRVDRPVARRQRLGEAALVGAQARHDIVPRPRKTRRRARIAVDQRFDEEVGVNLLDFLRHAIHEPQHRTGLRAFLLVNGTALRARAEVAPIVLRHPRHVDRHGVFAYALIRLDVRQHVGHHEPQDIRIGQAQLGTSVTPGAIHLAEVFGVLLKPFGAGQQPVERMGAAQVADKSQRATAMPRLHAVALSVHATAHGKVRMVAHIHPGGIAEDKRGRLRVVQASRHGKHVAPGHDLVPAGEPPHAAVGLQKFVDAVQDAALVRTHDKQMRRHGQQAETFVTQFARRGCAGGKRGRVARHAQNHGARRKRLGIVDHRQSNRRHLLDIAHQLLGGVAFGRRSVAPDHHRRRSLLSAAGEGKVSRRLSRQGPRTYRRKDG